MVSKLSEELLGPCIFYQEPFYYLVFSGDFHTSPYYHKTVARSTSVDGVYERYNGEQASDSSKWELIQSYVVDIFNMSLSKSFISVLALGHRSL